MFWPLCCLDSLMFMNVTRHHIGSVNWCQRFHQHKCNMLSRSLRNLESYHSRTTIAWSCPTSLKHTLFTSGIFFQLIPTASGAKSYISYVQLLRHYEHSCVRLPLLSYFYPLDSNIWRGSDPGKIQQDHLDWGCCLTWAQSSTRLFLCTAEMTHNSHTVMIKE